MGVPQPIIHVMTISVSPEFRGAKPSYFALHQISADNCETVLWVAPDCCTCVHMLTPVPSEKGPLGGGDNWGVCLRSPQIGAQGRQILFADDRGNYQDEAGDGMGTETFVIEILVYPQFQQSDEM